MTYKIIEKRGDTIIYTITFRREFKTWEERYVKAMKRCNSLRSLF